MAKQTQPKVKRVYPADAANRIVSEMKGKSTLAELAEKADALIVASGGKSNVQGAAYHVRRALGTAEALGVVKLVRPTDLFAERVR